MRIFTVKESYMLHRPIVLRQHNARSLWFILHPSLTFTLITTNMCGMRDCPALQRCPPPPCIYHNGTEHIERIGSSLVILYFIPGGHVRVGWGGGHKFRMYFLTQCATLNFPDCVIVGYQYIPSSSVTTIPPPCRTPGTQSPANGEFV